MCHVDVPDPRDARHAAWGGGAFVPHYEGLAAKIGQLLVVPLTHVMAAHGCAHDDTPSAPHLAPERVRVRPQLPRSLQTASGGISVGRCERVREMTAVCDYSVQIVFYML